VVLWGALLAVPATAQARDCGRVKVSSHTRNAKVRVVRGELSCGQARRLIAAAYGAEAARRWDGMNERVGVFWHVMGWRCSTGLAWSESFCERGKQQVDGSVRTDDGWSF